ncbi:MAG: sulfotransferase domain-containing protein [Gemmatimonadales bacterium]
MIWILIVAGLVLLLLAQMVYLSFALVAGDRKTEGLGYFGLPAPARDRFRRTLRRQALLLRPMLRLLSRSSRFTFEKATFRHRDLAGPRGTCGPATFDRAEAYCPEPQDVFVAAQMKCGTTWMLHVVYQVLRRGAGDLVETGTALHAVSPWLEGRKTVATEDAPLVGSERPSRLIKTHLPASRCPDAPEARFIYVARHPVACFASCADFIAANAGSFAPALSAVEEWFMSPEWMWWGTWPAHVRGWWARAAERGNVLFVRFEEMTQDLGKVVRRIEALLGTSPLTGAELGRVREKCSFAYMKAHAEAFEMHPPHLLSVDADLFVKGSADRHLDVPEDARERIRAWCAAELREAPPQVPALYPDLRAG